jgi:hypothetical protein
LPYFVLKILSQTKIINFPKSQMENITKSRVSIILKKKPKTIIIGKNNIPIPDRMLTAIRKIKPMTKAFILSSPFIFL